jgi:hypothetical protein
MDQFVYHGSGSLDSDAAGHYQQGIGSIYLILMRKQSGFDQRFITEKIDDAIAGYSLAFLFQFLLHFQNLRLIAGLADLSATFATDYKDFLVPV